MEESHGEYYFMHYSMVRWMGYMFHSTVYKGQSRSLQILSIRETSAQTSPCN